MHICFAVRPSFGSENMRYASNEVMEETRNCVTSSLSKFSMLGLLMHGPSSNMDLTSLLPIEGTERCKVGKSDTRSLLDLHHFTRFLRDPREEIEQSQIQLYCRERVFQLKSSWLEWSKKRRTEGNDKVEQEIATSKKGRKRGVCGEHIIHGREGGSQCKSDAEETNWNSLQNELLYLARSLSLSVVHLLFLISNPNQIISSKEGNREPNLFSILQRGKEKKQWRNREKHFCQSFSSLFAWGKTVRFT